MGRKDFSQVQEMARAFFGDDFFDQIALVTGGSDSPSSSSSSGPAVDVYHSKSEVIVVINLPGMENIHTIDLKVKEDVLNIKGSFDSPYQAYEATLLERKRGLFERSIPLPAKVKEVHDSARYKKGVLEIRYSKLT